METVEIKWVTDYRNQSIRTGLKKIWRECFGDPEEYIDFFFDHVPEEMQLIAAFEKEKIIGNIYVFPGQVLWPERHTKKVYYLYAVGVLKDYRGRHLFSCMLRKIREKTEKEGAGIILYAMPELRALYEKKGFICYYRNREIELINDHAEKMHSPSVRIEREPVKIKEYEAMRRERFEGSGLLSWGEDMLRYCLYEKQYCGGICDFLIIDGHKYAVIGEIKEGVLYVEETTLPETLLMRYQRELFTQYQVSRMVVRLPVTQETDTERHKKDETTVYAGMGDFEADKMWLALTLV